MGLSFFINLAVVFPMSSKSREIQIKFELIAAKSTDKLLKGGWWHYVQKNFNTSEKPKQIAKFRQHLNCWHSKTKFHGTTSSPLHCNL